MRLAFAATLISLFAATAATASPILPGVLYELNNHPDGAIAAPFYGLRLDGLMGDVGDEYTFDFDAPESNMTLFWDDTAETLIISGQSFGGEDVGEQYGAGTTAIWQIDFLYTNVVDTGAQLQVAESDPTSGTGTITNLSTQQVFQLIDFGDDTTFFLGDGHRGVDGASGWGWLNHSGAPGGLAEHVYSSDWLFSVGTISIPVPEPSAGLLLSIGVLLGCFTGTRRA